MSISGVSKAATAARSSNCGPAGTGAAGNGRDCSQRGHSPHGCPSGCEFFAALVWVQQEPLALLCSTQHDVVACGAAGFDLASWTQQSRHANAACTGATARIAVTQASIVNRSQTAITISTDPVYRIAVSGQEEVSAQGTLP